VGNTPPTLATIAPNTGVSYGSNVTVTATGSGFVNPLIYLDEQLQATTPVDANSATAVVESWRWGTPGIYQMVVQNADGTRSVAQPFTFTASELAAASEEEFPVDEFPIEAVVIPDETPGPYPLDEEPPKKAQPKKAAKKTNTPKE
jgi:hypothetical protein